MTEQEYKRKKKMHDSIIDYRRLLEKEWQERDKHLAVIEAEIVEKIDEYEMREALK